MSLPNIADRYQHHQFYIVYRMEQEGLRAIVFGCTGAIGAELVALLMASNKWASVHCVARRRLPEWQTLPNPQKLTVEETQDLGDYLSKQNEGPSFDSLFCCLGSQTKHGTENFIRVDKTYPLMAAEMALKRKIPHYLLVSSMGSDPKSWFLYPRTKGEVEAELGQKKLNLLTVMRPGLLRDRREARTIEKALSWLPFVPGINAHDAAQVLKRVAERDHETALQARGEVRVLENKDMVNILKGD